MEKITQKNEDIFVINANFKLSYKNNFNKIIINDNKWL